MGNKAISMKVLVTGGGGFLGGALVRRLVQEGYQVSSFSRGAYPWLDSLGVQQFRGDLGDQDAVEKAVSGQDAVFHVAAKAGIWGKPEEFYRTNVLGTENVIAACRRQGVRKLVYTSSPSVVFGGTDLEGVDESVPYPSRFTALYPKTKAQAEALVLRANDGELATLALRPHLIWGPGDTHIGPGLIERARQGKLTRLGKRENLVDITYIDNAVEAHIKALEHLSPSAAASGRPFFISQGEPIPLWTFISEILKAAGISSSEKTIPPQVGYFAGWICEGLFRLIPSLGEPPITRFLAQQMSTAHWFDISAARQYLNYRPVVETSEGFRRLRSCLSDEPSAQSSSL